MHNVAEYDPLALPMHKTKVFISQGIAVRDAVTIALSENLANSMALRAHQFTAHFH